MTTDAIIDAVIAREGPFSNLAADRGGPTNWGITQATLAAWRGHPVSAAEVAALTRAEATTIYRALYVERPGFDRLPPALTPFMVDFGVNSGPPLATGALQEVVGVAVDHTLGPRTLAAALAAPTTPTLTRLVAWRIMMVARVVRRDPSQLINLAGWLSRALSFLPGITPPPDLP